MRKVVAFLMWLFSFWTWKGFFLRWLGSPSSRPASGETVEHLASQEGQQPESELARFLSSLPGDERECSRLNFDRDLEVLITFGRSTKTTVFHASGGMEAAGTYREFLAAVASSEIVFCEEVSIVLFGEEYCKHMEAFADALRQSGSGFRKLKLGCWHVSLVAFAKCTSSVLLGNAAIQDLRFYFVDREREIGNEDAAEFASIVAVPRNLRVLKAFRMDVPKSNREGMEQLLKPFRGPPCALEELELDSATVDAHLEHISGVLASSTSLKLLTVNTESSGVDKKAFTKGYTSIAAALCSNQSLTSLCCRLSTSTELKALLDPLVPKNNNLQPNTTLTKLTLLGSVGGGQGIETLADTLCTNRSLLELTLNYMDEFSLHGEGGIENVLAILEALKTNKSLKRIGFEGCEAVGGHRVLGAMMDLLLENHYIEAIDLDYTPLEESGDANCVYSALSKRRER